MYERGSANFRAESSLVQARPVIEQALRIKLEPKLLYVSKVRSTGEAISYGRSKTGHRPQPRKEERESRGFELHVLLDLGSIKASGDSRMRLVDRSSGHV